MARRRQISDVDAFARQVSGTRAKERKQYQFEERVIRNMVAQLHRDPLVIMRDLQRDADEDQGIAFWQFHQAFTFPIMLTGYKLRRIDFLTALKKLDKTPLMLAWKRHKENYEGFGYLGVFYETRGDSMPIMLMHNCDRFPLVAPHWRCQLALSDEETLFFEPMKSAFISFQKMGWLLEEV